MYKIDKKVDVHDINLTFTINAIRKNCVRHLGIAIL
jgi:hypothetical protein